MKKYAVNQTVIGDILLVAYDDGSVRTFDAIKLGVEWFYMSNDSFFNTYGFNFNPHKYGLYEICRKLAQKGS